MTTPNINVLVLYPGVEGHEQTTMITEQKLAALCKTKKAMREFAEQQSEGATFKFEGKTVPAFPSKILFSKETENGEQILHSVEYQLTRIEPLTSAHVTEDGTAVSISIVMGIPNNKEFRMNVLEEFHSMVLKKSRKVVDQIILNRLNFKKKKNKFNNIQDACDQIKFKTVIVRSHELGQAFFDLNEGCEEYRLKYEPKQPPPPQPIKTRTWGGDLDHDWLSNKY